MKQMWDKNDIEAIAHAAGGGAFVVTMTLDEDMGFVSADKTFAQMLAAAKSGQMLTCKVQLEDGTFVGFAPGTGISNELAYFKVGYGSNVDLKAKCNNSNVWTVE